jgi:asparagine synthase (glutamine-hydrolysing)
MIGAGLAKLLVQQVVLKPNARRVLREHLTYLSTIKLWRLERALAGVVRNQVQGDLLEFGVALGGSAILISGYATNGRRFHGFDVFSMIPPPTSTKDDDKSRSRYDLIKNGKSGGLGGEKYYGYRKDLLQDVRNSFARHGRPVDGDNIQLHKGLFEETWPKLRIEQVSFAHIDCDWYDPVKYCLTVVYDRLSPGGVILLDDYHDYGGAQTAVDEFIATHPDYVMLAGRNPILRKN